MKIEIEIEKLMEVVDQAFEYRIQHLLKSSCNPNNPNRYIDEKALSKMSVLQHDVKKDLRRLVRKESE